MKFYPIIILVFSIVIQFSCSSSDEKQLELNGTVIGVDTKSIMLVKTNQDFRVDSIWEIPVIDGKFKFKTKLDHSEAVNLAFSASVEKGMFRTMPLFLENENITVTLYPEEAFDTNSVEGGTLNAQYRRFKEEADSLFRRPEFVQQLNWQQEEYISEYPTLVSYYLFLEQLIFFKEYLNLDLAKENYKLLSEKHPNHPYNVLAGNLLAAIENIQVGKPYLDFSAPDLNGNLITLSEQINGKVALLDLWATWCGPCITKTRTMEPLYDEYKDKGFTIVGVAGEFKNTNRLEKFLEKEQWQWTNLVELDRQHNIWQKYGVDNSGGAIFLIDEKGIIVAKNPSVEEVRNQIEKWLN